MPGGTGTPVSVGSGFTSPKSVAICPNGDVFVGDVANVKKISGGSTSILYTSPQGSQAAFWGLLCAANGDVYAMQSHSFSTIFKFVGGAGAPATFKTIFVSNVGQFSFSTNGDLWTTQNSIVSKTVGGTSTNFDSGFNSPRGVWSTC